MPKNQNQIQESNHNVIIRIIIGVLVIVIGLITIRLNTTNDTIKFYQEYTKDNNKQATSGKTYLEVDIPKDNIIKYAKIDEINNIIKTKTGVIYLGYPTCPWCRNVVPVLLEAASSTSLGQIYYLDMTNIRDQKEVDTDGNIKTTKEPQKGYEELLTNLDSILDDYIIKDQNGQEYNTNEKRIYVPLVIFVKEGQIIASHAGTVDTQKDPYQKMTREEHDKLYNIYLDNIQKTLGDVCNEKDYC